MSIFSQGNGMEAYMSNNRKKTMRSLLFWLVLLAMLSTTVFAGETAAFTDVSGHWAESYIGEAAQRQLAKGYNGLYRPDDSMTRAEMVTMLWRAMGEPKPTKAASFTDLTQDWYKDAVAWAEEQKVVNGIGDGKFGPDGNVTREQLAAILHRLAGGTVTMEVMLLSSIYDGFFTDVDKVSEYAKNSIYWCVAYGVYCGVAAENTGTTLAPKTDATRGQIAVMLVRFLDRE